MARGLKEDQKMVPLCLQHPTHPEVVSLLLEKGAQVDLSNRGWTHSLVVSAFKGHSACIRLLVAGQGRSPASCQQRIDTPRCLPLKREAPPK